MPISASRIAARAKLMKTGMVERKSEIDPDSCLP